MCFWGWFNQAPNRPMPDWTVKYVIFEHLAIAYYCSRWIDLKWWCWSTVLLILMQVELFADWIIGTWHDYWRWIRTDMRSWRELTRGRTWRWEGDLFGWVLSWSSISAWLCPLDYNISLVNLFMALLQSEMTRYHEDMRPRFSNPT